jgi:hypothetical protein
MCLLMIGKEMIWASDALGQQYHTSNVGRTGHLLGLDGSLLERTRIGPCIVCSWAVMNSLGQPRAELNMGPCGLLCALRNMIWAGQRPAKSLYGHGLGWTEMCVEAIRKIYKDL